MTWEGSWTSWTLSTLLGIHWIIPLPSAIHQLANDGLSSLIFFWDETIRYIFAGVSIHYSSRTTLSFASTSASELIYILGVEFARNRDSMLPINWSESAGNRPTELRTNCMETAVSIESIDWWLWLGIIVDNFVDREKKRLPFAPSGIAIDYADGYDSIERNVIRQSPWFICAFVPVLVPRFIFDVLLDTGAYLLFNNNKNNNNNNKNAALAVLLWLYGRLFCFPFDLIFAQRWCTPSYV